MSRHGFTIVELLIVIVVIGVLAAITVVAFGTVQSKARDSTRAADLKSVIKALESYKVTNGQYPTATPTSGAGSFEQSTDTPGTFLEALVPTYFSKAPLDPTNDASHYFRYYRYDASAVENSYGCGSGRGALMVLYGIGFEKSANVPPVSDPVICTSRTWQGGGTTFFYSRFENE
jgi:type II secretion system protein G